MARTRIVGPIGVGLLVVGLAASPAGADTIADRFPVPKGCTEATPEEGSFAAWLAARPLASEDTPVRTADGDRVRFTFSPALAVLDMDLLGPQDCADSVIRLRGDYLWSAGGADDLTLKYLSGDAIPWARWAEGCRPKLNLARSRVARWDCGDTRTDGRDDFTAYLKNVMRYANSFALARDLTPIDPNDVGPGDVLTQPNPSGGIGHAAIVARTITCDDGATRRHLVVNGFLPPQSVHVIGRRTSFGALRPWFTISDYESQMRPLGATFAYRRFE